MDSEDKGNSLQINKIMYFVICFLEDDEVIAEEIVKPASKAG